MQLDPLNSPHPVPWNWILAAHNAALAANRFTPQHYRSAALRSPDGNWMAYSRIHLELQPQLYACQVSSILLLENLAAGTLQPVAAQSPFAQGFVDCLDGDSAVGSISILMPIGWNQSGDQLLVRQFEGRFCSSCATDYGLVWSSHNGKTQILAPPEVEQAILLGWSHSHPQSILFEAGDLSQAEWSRWLVAPDGTSTLTQTDKARVFGEAISTVLTGPQTSLC